MNLRLIDYNIMWSWYSLFRCWPFLRHLDVCRPLLCLVNNQHGQNLRPCRIPPTRLRRICDRAFPTAATRIWNRSDVITTWKLICSPYHSFLGRWCTIITILKWLQRFGTIHLNYYVTVCMYACMYTFLLIRNTDSINSKIKQTRTKHVSYHITWWPCSLLDDRSIIQSINHHHHRLLRQIARRQQHTIKYTEWAIKNRPPTCQLIMSSKSNVHLKWITHVEI